MMTEFHLKFHHSVQNFLFSKHQNKVILAISLLISRTSVVLKTSVAPMTSTDMIKSLASMTQQPLWPQKIKSCLHFNYWMIRNVSILNDLKSLIDLSGLNGLNSLISSKNLLSMMLLLTWQQNDLSWSPNVQ
jgi:hypothetical protein